MMKPGDLIKDTSDGEIGLVLSHPRSYDLTREDRENARVAREHAMAPYREFVFVKWPSYDEQSRVVLEAVRQGWIEVISEAEKTTNR